MEKVQKNSVNSVQHTPSSESFQVYYTECSRRKDQVHCTLYRRATRHALTRVAKCIDVDGGIFENTG
jgi:hypothetical protein